MWIKSALLSLIFSRSLTHSLDMFVVVVVWRPPSMHWFLIVNYLDFSALSETVAGLKNNGLSKHVMHLFSTSIEHLFDLEIKGIKYRVEISHCNHPKTIIQTSVKTFIFFFYFIFFLLIQTCQKANKSKQEKNINMKEEKKSLYTDVEMIYVVYAKKKMWHIIQSASMKTLFSIIPLFSLFLLLENRSLSHCKQVFNSINLIPQYLFDVHLFSCHIITSICEGFHFVAVYFIYLLYICGFILLVGNLMTFL